MSRPAVSPSGASLTADALDARCADGGAFPIVEPGACTFAHHGPADAVRLVHFGVGFPTDLRFEPVDDSDWWVLPLAVPDGTRVEYKVEVVDSCGTAPRRGPLNPTAATHPFGANSVLEAHGYDRACAFATPIRTSPAARSATSSTPSAALGRRR